MQGGMHYPVQIQSYHWVSMTVSPCLLFQPCTAAVPQGHWMGGSWHPQVSFRHAGHRAPSFRHRCQGPVNQWMSSCLSFLSWPSLACFQAELPIPRRLGDNTRFSNIETHWVSRYFSSARALFVKKRPLSHLKTWKQTLQISSLSLFIFSAGVLLFYLPFKLLKQISSQTKQISDHNVALSEIRLTVID